MTINDEIDHRGHSVSMKMTFRDSRTPVGQAFLPDVRLKARPTAVISRRQPNAGATNVPQLCRAVQASFLSHDGAFSGGRNESKDGF
jgi:hypothetical protein